MKSKYILYTCERGEPLIISENYCEYRIIPSFDYEPRGLITFSNYRIMIGKNYGKLSKKEDLESLSNQKVCYLTDNRIENRWAVEELAAYYGKFMVLLRRYR